MEQLATEENIRFIKEHEDLLHGSTKKLVQLYLMLLDKYGIDKAQVFSVIPEDNRFMSRLKKYGNERLFPLGMVVPTRENLNDQLESVREFGLYGLKIHPDFQKLDFKAREFSDIFSFCEQHKMLVISHTGSHGNLRDIVAQAKDFPLMPFILGHMGLSPQVDQAYNAAKEYKNVYLEISGQGYQYMIQKAIDDPDIGSERVLYGSDFPSLEPKVEMEKVHALNVSTEIKQKIFHDNLKAIYNSLGIDL